MNTFSIIIPTYNRVKEVVRAITSLVNQDYEGNLYEIIVVDDGSTDDTADVLERLSVGPPCQFKYIRLPENKGRLTARNRGMAEAKMDWICWLDSDDEYVSTYLSTLNRAIETYPEYQIFNFGAVVYDEANFHSHVRNAFLPELRPDGRGHVQFKSGGIGTGSFIFRNELAAKCGPLPEARTPYGDFDSFAARATLLWPELEHLYGKNENGQWLPFGNPWGDDWLMFYLLTREHKSKPLDIALYIQHVRH